MGFLTIRRPKREQAAQMAANHRDSFPDAIKEVLSSPSNVKVWVGSGKQKTKIEGSRDGLSVVEKDEPFWSAPLFAMSVEHLSMLVGPNYDVVGLVHVTVSSPSFGLAMDRASGYSNPRTHATNFQDEIVAIKSRASLVEHEHVLREGQHFSHYITVSPRR